MAKGFLVKSTIAGAHDIHVDYSLLEDDLLTRNEDGTFAKVCPGLSISGFKLTAEQEASLQSVEYKLYGLNYKVLD